MYRFVCVVVVEGPPDDRLFLHLLFPFLQELDAEKAAREKDREALDARLKKAKDELAAARAKADADRKRAEVRARRVPPLCARNVPFVRYRSS